MSFREPPVCDHLEWLITPYVARLRQEMVAKGKGKGCEGKEDQSTGFFEGFAGTTNGSFFASPSWVDQKKKPGYTSQTSTIENNPNWRSLLSGAFLFWSPNLVWLLVALFVWLVFPYDFQAGKTWASDWVLRRLAVNTGVIFGYVGFWHVTLVSRSFFCCCFSSRLQLTHIRTPLRAVLVELG